MKIYEQLTEAIVEVLVINDNFFYGNCKLKFLKIYIRFCN